MTSTDQHRESLDTFPDLPIFPSDIPTAPLLRLSLALLRSSTTESARLWSAATNLGFFYLDLRGDPTGEKLLSESNSLFEFGKQLFDIGREELEKYDYSAKGSYFGYKGFGKGVVDKDGSRDGNEFYNIPKDDILSISPTPLAHPNLLQQHASLLRSYTTNAHALLTFILDHLSSHLGLPPKILRDIHAQSLASGDHIRIVKSPPKFAPSPSVNGDKSPSMGAHTDFGSLTLLVNRLGGLQVLPPNRTSSWLYVRPLPGHAIINLGDALVKFTNGLLKSNIHRVVAPPGEQAKETRYSLVYFMRPGDDVVLKRLNGGQKGVIPELEFGVVEEDVKSAEWIKDKAFARRVGVTEHGRVGRERETSALAIET